MSKRKVVLIGWDAADWRAIDPLIAQGKMPHLQQLIERGVRGSIATLHPIYSPMLWTSIATGKRPFKHGILGFSEPTPDGQSVRPVSNLSRKVKAIWNILTQQGMTSNVVGWWPSHPAEPIDGVMVSNNYQRAVGPLDKGWPMAPETVHPPELAEQMKELRFHPQELEQQHVLPFVPNAAEIDQDKDRRLASLMKIIADCTSVQSASTYLLEERPADLNAFYFDAIDHFGHGFMRYHPPKLDHVKEEDFEMFKGVIEAGYRYHDLMLGRLMQLAGDDATIILVSDHGFHPDHLRVAQVPLEPAGPAAEHGDFGILVMAGPGIKKGDAVHGATLLDITPTLLAMYGLPVGEDMDGKPLVGAFVDPPHVEQIPSWDEVAGEAGTHSRERALDPIGSAEALKQLVELGYVEDFGDDKEKAVENTARELRYNLAQSYMDADRHPDAAEILEKLYDEFPKEQRFGTKLAMCYRAMGRIADLRRTVELLMERSEKYAVEAREELRGWRAEIAERREKRGAEQGGGDDEPTSDATSEQSPEDDLKENLALAQQLAEAEEEERLNAMARPVHGDSPENEQGDADAGGDAGDSAAAPTDPLITPKERQEIRQLMGRAHPNKAAFEYLMGFVLMAEGETKAAIEKLESAMQAQRNRPGLHIQIGQAYMKLRRMDDAIAAFNEAARIDPKNPHAELGLARAAIIQRRFEDAAEHALNAIGRMYQYPFAHYILGIALLRMRRPEAALDAFQTAVSLNPNFRQAYLRMALIYGRFLNDPHQAMVTREMARFLRKANRDRALKRREKVEADRAAEQTPPVIEDAPLPPLETVVRGPYDPEREVVVVAGLPRSGTSMVMQMLEAGGVEPLVDDHRPADEDNPKGYFEYAPAKRLRRERDWVADAKGKAVKIVAQNLPYLPRGHRYRVIFIERDMDEVMQSQRKMLARSGKGDPEAGQRIRSVFRSQLLHIRRWLGAMPAVSVLSIDHRETIAKPDKTASLVSKFLDGVADAPTMAAVVDPSLYRNRSDTPDSTDSDRGPE